MAKISWSDFAVNHLEEIRDDIARYSLQAADRTYSEIVQHVELLRTHPLLGRTVPEFPESPLREIIHDEYRIVYRSNGDLIRIVFIAHGKRDLRKFLKMMIDTQNN